MQHTFAYVSCGEGREIDVFQLDPVSGGLQLRQRVMTEGMPVPMRVRSDVQRLYVGMRMSNALQAFSIDPESGLLATLGGVSAPGSPVYVSVDPERRLAFLPSYGDNQLSVFPLDDKGLPLAASQTLLDLPRAHAACIDPGGRWLLVPTLGADVICIFRITGAGRLEAADPPTTAVTAGSGPRHPVFSKNGRWVFCLNELNGCIDTFEFDAQRGALELRHSLSMMPPDFSGAPWTAELRIRPDGAFLFATDRRSSTIATLAIDSRTGGLSVVEHTQTEEQPRGMDIDPSGRWLLCAGQQSAALTVYAIDAASGHLLPCERYRTGKEPICIEMAWI